MRNIFIIVIAAILSVTSARAQDITVRKPGTEHFLLDLSGFKSSVDEGAPALFLQTLKMNLARSGWFTVIESGRADFTVVGTVDESRSVLRVRCEAHHAVTRERLLSERYRDDAETARSLAHRVSDDIVFALTGRPGIASTRIVMVGTRTGGKELYVCDADGGNLRQLTKDNTISVGPKWGPCGKRIVYTSFRSGFPDVFLVDLETGVRRCIARYPGLNACASISPDGRKVALTLSKDGNPDLFIMDLAGGRLTRLTSMRHAAQASPSWSPDGRRIVFVSDAAGAPQLFIIDSAGGAPSRVTFRGSENVEPDWGANGLIVYSSRVRGRYSIHILNPDTQETRKVSRTDADYISPSWAPDGRHIVCERRLNHNSRIFIIDAMSDSSISLLPESVDGEWHSPDWSAE